MEEVKISANVISTLTTEDRKEGKQETLRESLQKLFQGLLDHNTTALLCRIQRQDAASV